MNDPTQWEAGHRGTFTGCAGPCNQGRRLCPCPEACHAPMNEPERLFWKRVGLVILCISAFAVLFSFYVLFGDVKPFAAAAFLPIIRGLDVDTHPLVMRATLPTHGLIGPKPMAWTSSVGTDIRRRFDAVRLEQAAQEYAADAGPSALDIAQGSF